MGTYKATKQRKKHTKLLLFMRETETLVQRVQNEKKKKN